MAFAIEYDQIDPDEQRDEFETLDQVREFASTQLNGSYPKSLTFKQLVERLEQNGYYLTQADQLEQAE